MYKVFTYMVLARLEPVLEANQLEEQHGFRAGRRLEEHLVPANLVIDKLLAVGKPGWIVSLDLSKAFDRVNFFFCFDFAPACLSAAHLGRRV